MSIRVRSRRCAALTVLLVFGAALADAQPAAAPANGAVVDEAVLPTALWAIPVALPHSAGYPELFAAANRVVAPAIDVAKLMEEDAQVLGGPLRMGVVQDFAADAAQRGRWTELTDGGWLWTLDIQATGALAVRVRVDDWKPPVGAELIVYDPQAPDAALGPINGSYPTDAGRLWTPTVYSEEVYLEYYLRPGLDHTRPELQPHVAGVLNQYRIHPFTGDTAAELPCHLDVTCYPAWAGAATGVGALSSISNPFGYFCSGAMLNRSPTDFTPVFMTAAHCGVNAGNAATVLVTWFYQTSVCNGVPPNPNTLPQTAGVTLLANDITLDWTLIGLSVAVPGGVTFEGWDAGYFANGLNATSISHPRGTYKRIAFGSKVGDDGSRPDPANPPNCTGSDHTHVQFAQGNGRIEPGSSGSPLFDDSARVRGTLSCGDSPGCTGTQNGDYGRLDQMYPELQPFLIPADPVYVNGSYGGFEAGTVAQPFITVLKGAFAVQSGHNVYIETDSYVEHPTIHKAMTLHSRNGIAVIH